MDPKPLMRSEWDRIAKENPYYGIAAWDEFARPGTPDEARFYESGAVLADNLVLHLGLGDTSAMSVVEIGCGMGRVTHRLAARFREVWALDISPEMIMRAKQRWGHLTNVHFEVTSGSDLAPVQSGAADVVLSFIVLHHVVDPAVVLNYLEETGRVLKVGGLALLHLHTVEGSLLRRVLRRLHPRSPVDDWWNRGFEPHPVTAAAPPVAIVTSPVWRGCRVQMTAVRRAIRRASLELVRSEGEGTFWTLLSLRKAP